MSATDPASAISIVFATPADAPRVAELIGAMDAHYRPGETLPPAGDYRAMVAATLREREGTRFVLASGADGAPLGLACIAVIRPGRDLKGLVYLKDLFVVEAARGRGLGRRLMAFIARFAADNGIGRIDFTTDRGNEGAQRLYAALGAQAVEKIYYTLPGVRLAALAAEAS